MDKRRLAVIGVLLGVWAAVVLWRWPVGMDFKAFAFYDPGSALRADRLVGEGMMPGVEFAYSYGLLPLTLGRAWFGVFGRSPWAYQGLCLLMAGLLIAALARTAAALKWGWREVALLAVLIPVATPAFYLNQTHAMEAALLAWAVAEQARGRRRHALALVTACVFIKPSMAYVYGVVLTTWIVAEAWRGRGADPTNKWRWELLRNLCPAAAIGIVLTAAMTLMWGWRTVLGTVVPTQARKSYEAAGFGFFKAGREFWWGRGWDYLTTEAGWWLVSSALLLASAAWVAGRRRHAVGKASPAQEMVLTLALLHGVFVFCFYAWAGSWMYYGWLLALGITAAVGLREGWAKWILWGVVIGLAVTGQAWHPADGYWAWQREHASRTGGLWAYRELAEDWEQARAMVKNRKVLWLVNGYVEGLDVGVQPAEVPQSWFMSPGLQPTGELAKLRQQIANADVVVRFAELGRLDPWRESALAEVTREFQEQAENKHFLVMKRMKNAAR